MRIHTVKGSCYVLTCTVACRVQAIRTDGGGPLLVLEADKAGQFCFVAPTDAVEVSDEHALVTQTFKAASLGLSAQGGGIGSIENVTLNSLSAATVACSGTATFQNMDVSGLASFSSGVTMGQSLSVAGTATMRRCAVYEEAYSLMFVQTGTAVWKNREYASFRLEGDDSGAKEVELRLGGSNGNQKARIFKANQGAPLNNTDVLNTGEMDARYGRVGTSNTWDGDQTIMGDFQVAGHVISNMTLASSVSFDAGVTMAQTLTVEGSSTLKGGLGVSETVTFYDSVGVMAATITGMYGSPDENGVELGNSSGARFLSFDYNSRNKYVGIRLPISGSSLHLPVLPSIDVDGSCSAKSFLFGPNSISFDPSDPTRVATSGEWDFGIATFSGGVTMSQSLNVAGVASLKTGVFGPAEQLNIYGSGPRGYISSKYGELVIRSDTAAYVVEFRGESESSTVDITKQRSGSLNGNSLLNRTEGDARWLKFNNTLSDAQYAALEVKDQTTLYITDTGKVYLGNHALN